MFTLITCHQINRTILLTALAHTWVQWSADAAVHPPNAVRAGADQDGSPIFVGRALHYGEFLPAKVIPIRRVAFVTYNGFEISKPDFEVGSPGTVEFKVNKVSIILGFMWTWFHVGSLQERRSSERSRILRKNGYRRTCVYRKRSL